jgi:hypothetical protein
MSDFSIRPITLAEQAEAAARRFSATGEHEPNPHAGTAQEAAWEAAFARITQETAWAAACRAHREGLEASA